MKTKAEALALARSILAGKPEVGCPIPFSHVGGAKWLAEYVLEEEAYLYGANERTHTNSVAPGK
jgi:hypothetical protein